MKDACVVEVGSELSSQKAKSRGPTCMFAMIPKIKSVSWRSKASQKEKEIMSQDDSQVDKQLSDAQKIKRTIKTPGWDLIVEKLQGLIQDVCDIRNLDFENDKIDNKDVLSTRKAIDLVEAWFTEVIGEVESAEMLQQSRDYSESDILKRID